MASKNHKYTLLNVQNDDAEIDLQFQDFEQQPASSSNNRESYSQNQAVYFNSFPDTGEDDQEKLLDDDDAEGAPKSTRSFWTFEYYQQFFDVESKQVGDRIIWSMIPKPGVNFLKSYIRPNPDLYGPFWICVTLVFSTAISGNLSNYLQSKNPDRWKYDFHLVTLATSCIFTYAMFVPILIWGVLLWRSSKANLTLLELICLYGYSMAIFVPVSLLWMIPLLWLKWCLGIVASVLSGGVLVRTILPALSHEAKKIAFGLAVLVLVLHAVLAIGFMLYFFYPPSSPAGSMTTVNTNISIPNAVANGKIEKGLEKEGQDKISKKSEEQSEDLLKDKKHERSENLENPNGESSNSEKIGRPNNKNINDIKKKIESTNSDKDKEKLHQKEPVDKEESKIKPVIQAMSLVREETQNDDNKNKKPLKQETQTVEESVPSKSKISLDEKLGKKTDDRKKTNSTATLKQSSHLDQMLQQKTITMTNSQEKSTI